MGVHDSMQDNATIVLGNGTHEPQEHGHLGTAAWIAGWFWQYQIGTGKAIDIWEFLLLTAWQRRGELVLPISSITTICLYIAGIAALLVLSLMIWALTRASSKVQTIKWSPQKCDKPLLLRCVTSHTRFFPRKHTFTYQYLQICLPVSFKGTCGSLVSVGGDDRTIFHVDPADYLARHSAGRSISLDEKLDEYLSSQVCIRQ